LDYYYFAASLPRLALGETPPLSREAFLALCRDHLTPADMAQVEALSAPATADKGQGFVRAWRAAETRLRNACARARAARRREDAASHLRPQEGADMAEKTVADAFGQADPLARERMLDRFRWQVIESLAGTNPFAPEALFAYALKLGLAARRAAQDPAEGAARAEALVAREPGGDDADTNPTEEQT
jgi:hypothetical protein